MHNCVIRVRLTMKLEHCSFTHSSTHCIAFSYTDRFLHALQKLRSYRFAPFKVDTFDDLCVRALNARTAIKCNSSMNANMCVVFEINNICPMCISNLNTIAGTFYACPPTCGHIFFFVAHLSPVSKKQIIFQKRSLCEHSLVNVQFGSAGLGSSRLESTRIDYVLLYFHYYVAAVFVRVVLMHRYK